MKKTLASILGLFIFFTGMIHAQEGTLALRGGIGMLVEETTLGFSGNFDFKIPKAPFVLSPYIQYYSKADLNKLYYGADLQIVKNVLKGFYIGIGGGMAKWGSGSYSRTSPNFSPFLGYRIKVLDKLCLFTEAKMFFNTKTNEDTDAFNSGQTIKGPLFDNDLSVKIGVGYLLK
jgi:hypothetical protein